MSDPGLFLVSSEFPPGPGGIGNHAHHIARGLARRGWRVAVAAPQDYVPGDEADEFVRDQPYEFVLLERKGPLPARLLRWRSTIRRAARDRRPALLVSSGTGPALFGGSAACMLGIPHVVVGHGKEFTGLQGLRGRWFAANCRRARLLVAVSRYTAQQAEKTGRSPGRIEVVPNGADGETLRPVAAEPGWRAERGLEGFRVLLTVGRICARKGQDIVVRALARIAAEQPRLLYVAGGLPAEGEELREIARSLGVEDRVKIPGPLAAGELSRWYSAADLFVLTSRPSQDGDVEGYGIVVIEAALCGTPAIVSRHGGLPETVVDGVTGWVVPPEDPEALAEMLRRLLADPERIRRAGIEARRRAAAECTWEARCARYDAIFREIIDDRAER